MRCLACLYDLRHLTEHRCPECGHTFDPHKEHTFDTGPHSPRWEPRQRPSAAVVVAIIITAALAVGGFACVVWRVIAI